MIESPVRPIDDGAVGEERGEAATDRIEEHALAVDVEVGFLLSCEAGLGQVLSGGAAADGDIAIGAVARFELSIGVGDLVPEGLRQRS